MARRLLRSITSAQEQAQESEQGTTKLRRFAPSITVAVQGFTAWAEKPLSAITA